MAGTGYSIPRLAGMLLMAFLGLASSVHLLKEWSIDNLLRAAAASESENVAAKLAEKLPQAEKIFSGSMPSANALEFLKVFGDTGKVTSLALFNSAGTGLYSSETAVPNARTGSGFSLQALQPEAMDALTNNNTFITYDGIKSPAAAGGVNMIAEAIVPVVKNGQKIGIASVHVDQTELAGMLRSNLNLIASIIVLLSAAGFAIPTFGVLQRTRQQQLADQQIAYLAQFDVLTGLQNRKTFEISLNDCLLESGQKGKHVALHFLDLDFFKAINDNYGHAFGDELLKEFSKRIKENLRPGDIGARFGGDEFVVALSGLTDIEELATATKTFYQAMKLPLQIMGKTIVPGVSMGTAMYPENGLDTSVLMHCADIALYVVKGQGRNGHKFFEPSFNQARLRRTDLEFLVRKNVVSRNFELNYQPYYSLETSRLEGFEALLRMKDVHGNQVSPAEFVPVAEDLGLITEIGAWVLNEACKFAKNWPSDIKLSVNLSSVQFRKKSACPSVINALKESGLRPEQLVVEITESVLLADVDEVREQIDQLNSYGVELAMDDFGTGYSSLSYILRLPFDRIKIDRSFVVQMSTGDANAKKVVETIVSLGHTMNMSVTAEGVETLEQAETLRMMGCDQAQGYYFSRPVAAADVPNLIMQSFVNVDVPPMVEQIGAHESGQAVA
jgi:diguanylate cyclase (GGDEF)-like protein